MKNPKIKYAICGQGPLKEYLEELAEKLGVRKQLFLLGFRTDVIEICKSADVFVFPSKREGLSVALMEAMACGLPCVVSNIRGNLDLIVDMRGGLVVNSTLSGSYAEALYKLLDDVCMIMEFSKYNFESIKKFSISTVNKKMAQIYLNKS